jgi:hypothetical protein
VLAALDHAPLARRSAALAPVSRRSSRAIRPPVGRVVVIVTQQVQQPVQRQDLQLVGVGMPGSAACRRATPVRDDDDPRVSNDEARRSPSVLAAVLSVERADAASETMRDRRLRRGRAAGATLASQAASPGARTARPRPSRDASTA